MLRAKMHKMDTNGVAIDVLPQVSSLKILGEIEKNLTFVRREATLRLFGVNYFNLHWSKSSN
jgi:hypothetical protein